MLVVNIEGEGNQLRGSLNTQGTIMLIVSLAAGTLFGELINLNYWVNSSVYGCGIKQETKKTVVL